MRQVNAKKLVLNVLFFFTVPAMLLLTLMLYYTVNASNSYNLNMTKNVLSLELNTTVSTIIAAEDRMDELAIGYDYLVFSNTSDRSKAAYRASALGNMLSRSLQDSPVVDGFYLYCSKADYLYTRLGSAHSLPEQQTLRDFFLETAGRMEPVSYPRQQDSGWLRIELGSGFVLMRIKQQDYGYIAVIASPSSDPGLADITMLEEGSSAYYSYLPEGVFPDVKNTAAVSSPEIDGLWLIYYQPHKTILAQTDTVQKLCFFLIMALLMSMPFLWLIVYRHLLHPLVSLRESVNIVRNGDLSHRADTTSGVEEIRAFSLALNEMLDTVKGLKISSYEQKLEISQARLQYLQVQIRPHFYLNCLKNMYSLIVGNEYQKAEDLILALSGYLQHLFRDNRSFLPLAEELTICDNYVHLCQLLGKNISLQLGISAECSNALVLPMTILTFIENSIKHTDVREGLSLRVSASIAPACPSSQYAPDSSNERELIISVADNGGGFPDEFLAQANAQSTSAFAYRHEHIGISNVLYRLRLAYDDSAAVAFENQDGGALVTIRQPYDKGGRIK